MTEEIIEQVEQDEQVVVEIVEKKALTIITDFADEDDNTLDVLQNQIVTILYTEAKEAAEPILNDDNLPISVKITKLLGAIMGLLEKARINGEKIVSENKRVIALYLLKRLIREILANSELRDNILHEVGQTASYLLETLVGVSKGMNGLEKKVMEKVTSFNCCDCILAFIYPHRK
jgi:hypothetical protein